MPRFLTFTPNPALDVSTSVGRIVPAHKLRCEEPQRHPGGGGINVARVLRRLGGDVVAVYPAGGGAGDRLHALLAEEGVPDVCIAIAGDTRESFTVHEREGGLEYRFVMPGPTLSGPEWEAVLGALASLGHITPAPRWVIASGSLPPGVDAGAYGQIAQIASEMGARVVVDSSGPALAAALAQGVWLVKPSLRELAELVGGELATLPLRRQAARQLIERGQARVVALSMGEEGAMLVTADRCLVAEGLNVPVAGSVGAGDSFLAGLVWALDADADAAVEGSMEGAMVSGLVSGVLSGVDSGVDSGRDGVLARALTTAMAAGAAAVMAPGTAMGTAGQMEALRAAVRVRELSGGQ